MKEIETGGPAFPFIDSASPLEHPGMTLRDYFAAKAMQGICSSALLNVDVGATAIADNAYEIADAMLNERNLL